MKYKLDQSVSKIIAPIILAVDDAEIAFGSGKALADAYFEKYYLIDSIGVRGESIVISLKANDTLNTTNWCGEEQEDFF